MKAKTASILTETVFEKFFEELRKDPDLYFGYQSNIAMAFVDTYNRYKDKMDKSSINAEDLHTIANDAAKYFLDLLIKK